MQEDENEKEVEGTPVAKRKILAEKKLDLFSKCKEATTANANTKAPLPNEAASTKISVFSLYVNEKLSQYINAPEEQLKNAYLTYYLK